MSVVSLEAFLERYCNRVEPDLLSVSNIDSLRGQEYLVVFLDKDRDLDDPGPADIMKDGIVFGEITCRRSANWVDFSYEIYSKKKQYKRYLKT